MQCCQVTCIVCEQVLASFPGSSPAFCHILYKTVCDKKLGRSLGTSSRYCSCHYMQCNANLIGQRCSCNVITSCCFMTVNEYVKAGYSYKLGVTYIYTHSKSKHHLYKLKVMPIISFTPSKLDIVCLISLSAGKWFIPTTTGCRLPPCAAFSFTAINDHLAVLFGGEQPRHGGSVSDCYVMNFETMVCTEVFYTNSSMEVYATHATLEMSAHSVGGRSCPSDTVITINNVQFTTAIYKL